MVSGWIALKHKSDPFGQWSISPRAYFEKHGHIPDSKAKLNVPGMDEVMDHTLVAKDGSDGRELLLAAGFEIEEKPVWYFERPGYTED